jgi:hypothetical protein
MASCRKVVNEDILSELYAYEFPDISSDGVHDNKRLDRFATCAGKRFRPCPLIFLVTNKCLVIMIMMEDVWCRTGKDLPGRLSRVFSKQKLQEITGQGKSVP